MVADVTPTDSQSLTDDPDFRAGVVDLLGVLGVGELTAFERMSADSGMAPTLSDKAALAGMAVTEFHHFERIRDRLDDLGVSMDEAMEPFRSAYENFHANTAPADWLEGLVKAYVGDGIAADFYRAVSAVVDDRTRAVMLEALSDVGAADFVVEHVRAAIDVDPGIAGRLALWGRRLVGEALVQAQRVATDRPALADLIVGGAAGQPGFDLADMSQLLTDLTAKHAARMERLGLAP